MKPVIHNLCVFLRPFDMYNNNLNLLLAELPTTKTGQTGLKQGQNWWWPAAWLARPSKGHTFLVLVLDIRVSTLYVFTTTTLLEFTYAFFK